MSYELPVIAIIFDLPATATSERVHISSAVLLDPKNEGLVLGISSLSSMGAEILRYFICTSGNSGHLLIY